MYVPKRLPSFIRIDLELSVITIISDFAKNSKFVVFILWVFVLNHSYI